MARRLRWCDRLGGPDMVVYLNRHCRRGVFHDTHRHDFAEFIFMRAGTVTHTVNGRSFPFHPGDIIFLRPDDRHTIEHHDAGTFSFDVIAFRHQAIPDLLALHPDELAPFRLDGEAQRHISLAAADRHWLDHRMRVLAAENDSRFLLHRFILDLAERYRQRRGAGGVAPLPDWLAESLDLLRDPRYFVEGPRVLASLSGRSYEHVSRVLRRCLGRTPSQVCNRARVEHAAAQLVLGDRPIVDIALDCGYQSLAHFYREFAKRYAMPPRRYREQNRDGMAAG